MVAAQPTAPAPSVVPVTWLAEHLKDPDLVVLHVGDRKEYDAGHIPGARHIEVRTISRPRTEDEFHTLELQPADQLEAALESLGIGNRSRILVYVGGDWVSPATRVVFTLDFAGLGSRTMLLDGGQPAWVKAGHALSVEVPPPATAGALTLAPHRDAVADLAWVREHAGRAGTVIVDARATEFYTGASDGRGTIPRPGHITGAVSLPFTSFFNDDNTLKPRPALEAMLATAGVTHGSTVVTYCHIGQQATVPYVVARLLGFDVRLYDGSFEEWSKVADAPVTKGDRPWDRLARRQDPGRPWRRAVNQVRSAYAARPLRLRASSSDTTRATRSAAASIAV